MVKLEEVSAEQFEEQLLSDDGDENYSDFSDDDFDDDDDESLLDRIAALKEIIPLKHRNRIASSASTLTSWGKTGATFIGKSAWVITTSMLLLVLPLALEIEKEQALVAYEKEAMQQQSGQQMLASGAMYGQPGQPGQLGQPGQQQQQQGLSPPGFQ